MKSLLPLALTVALLTAVSSPAAEPRAFVPHPATDSFYITNVTTAADVAAITASLKKVTSFNKIEALKPGSGYAEISFDAHANSYAQVAQAVTEAKSANGKRFEVSLKIRIADYAKADNAPKIDQVFAASKAAVTVETVNRQQGDFIIHFLPVKLDWEKSGPQGWNWGNFYHPVLDPAPKGLGLMIIRLHEGVTPAPAG